ncbi:MAG: hypothetical protein KDB27_04595 [Planctomycetales bacterium]|nr:hypothetical protein [Planctomycetales bacterium]
MRRFSFAISLLCICCAGCEQHREQELLQAKQNEAGRPIEWPELPTSGFLAGRVATEQDVSNGEAAFVAFGAVHSDRLAIDVPQYAFLTSDDGSRVPVFVVQAELVQGVNGDVETFGLRPIQGGDPIVGVAPNVTLLGTKNPGR